MTSHRIDWTEEIREAAAEAEDARHRFLNTILGAAAAGMTTRAIAAEAGLSHQRIHQILHGR